jgi:hypothetical protein
MLVSALLLGLTASPGLARSVSTAAMPGIIDRTILCSVPGPAAFQQMKVQVAPGVRPNRESRKWLRRATAAFSVLRAPDFAGHSVSVFAGWPPPEPEPGQPAEAGAVSLFVGASCVPTRAHVRLTTAGLSGGPARPIGDEYICTVPSRVLVRVRAVFRTRTSLRRSQRYTAFEVRGRTREAVLVVQTQAGKRIAVASVHESGNARLFTTRGCIED